MEECGRGQMKEEANFSERKEEGESNQAHLFEGEWWVLEAELGCAL